MPRRLGLPSVYLAAALATSATAAATTVPLVMTPASGLASRPAPSEPTRPYVVTARSRVAARDLVGEVRWRVRRYYTGALPGFATVLTAAELAELRADPRVRSVEPDRRIRLMPVTAPDGPPPGEGAGRGTTVYVVDSGVDRGRAAFADRVWRAFDATGGTGRDCAGHGTRAARLAHAAAPRAGIASVRVSGCGRSGTLTDVLAGLDWIHRHARGPAVASLALDGAGSPALDAAVRALARSGVFVVAAAGGGACRVAPGGAAYSVHAPHLAGVAARHLERHPAARPPVVASWLECSAAHDVMDRNPSGAPDLLLRNGGQ